VIDEHCGWVSGSSISEAGVLYSEGILNASEQGVAVPEEVQEFNSK
jgi:hypothetical protein